MQDQNGGFSCLPYSTSPNPTSQCLTISFLDHIEDLQTEQEKEAHTVRNPIAYCRSLPHHLREPSHIQLSSIYSYCGLYHYDSG